MPVLATYLEEVTHKLYDRVAITGTRERLFLVPVGESKTQAQTNMSNAGYLPAPQIMFVKKLTVAFFREDKPLPLRDPLWITSLISFVVGWKPYVEGPAFLYADPAAVLADSEHPETVWLKATHLKGLEFKEHVVIDRQQSFFAQASFVKEFLPPDPGTTIQVTLHGELMGPIA